ncbi:MAG: hypothetical protein II993_02345 [Anaerotignum sp.]|nr:hypothetical protein [Anaerotignum sp.]MBR3910984.1 hypothetical protein [Anaerotignum sp.]
MTNKKNRFFTLVFSCCPGAGEMYFGLYRHGVSLMSAFCAIAAVAFWLNWEELLLILPVIWCYSFFHTHNLRRLTEEEFREVKDGFFFENYVNCRPDWQLTEKHRRMFGVILLIFGLSIFWKTGMNLLGSFYHVPEFIWRFGNNIPQLAMAFVILYMALRMMKEPKEMDTEQNENLEEEQDAVVE